MNSLYKILDGLAITCFAEGVRIGAKIAIESHREGQTGRESVFIFNKKMEKAIADFARQKALITKTLESLGNKKGKYDGN